MSYSSRQAEGDKAMSIKTAQVFLKLGEVGLESETYPQSIEDFMSCLKIQVSFLCFKIILKVFNFLWELMLSSNTGKTLES